MIESDLLARTRVLFFTSAIGLGHATRDIAIAEKLREIVDNEILFITGGAAYELISREGFQALNLYRPPRFTVDGGKLHNNFVWLMKYVLYYKRSKKIADYVIRKTSHKPLIVSDEDFASIAAGQNVSSKNILIYDILEPGNKIGETHFLYVFLRRG
jgi:UDP-N-acetylglucosamine--N-acetylmuramyl-(pentapeptide) pyrophosphoryl-undecaprenol N-acetylglucosamine transferase